MNTTYDVFLSYARADERHAEDLQTRLEQNGIRCWRDRDQISPLEYFFPHRLADAVEQSAVAVVLLSDAYVSSYYCLQEFINCRVDQPLSNSMLRVLVLDPNLADHPLIEASGNSAIQQIDHASQEIAAWSRQFRPAPSRQEDFEELTADLLAELSRPLYSTSCHSYAKLVLGPLIESELVSRALARKELRGTHQRALDLQSRCEGARTTPQFLRDAIRSRVAYSHYILGNFGEALELRLEDYTAGLTRRGAHDFGVMQDGDMLVHCLHRLGRDAEAEGLAKRNLSLARVHFGPAHEMTLGALSSLAGIYADSGRYADALPFVKEAYFAKHAALDSSSDEWRSIVMNYGFVLMRTGNPKDALPLLRKVFRAYEEDFGLDNIDTSQAEIKLAECHLRLNDSALADTHAQSAMRAFSKLALSHPLRAHGAIMAIQCAYANSNLTGQQQITQKHINPLLQEGGDLADQVSHFISSNPEYFQSPKLFDDIESMMGNWASLQRKGFRTVSIETSETQSCGVCRHVRSSSAKCTIHDVDINFESWSCSNFQFTGESRIAGEVPESVWRTLPLTVDVAYGGALAGDPDCQFIIGVLCAHRALHQIIADKLASDRAISTSAVYSHCGTELSSSHWFSLAAMSDSPSSVGSKLARRMLDPNTPREDIERNVAAFWKYSEDFLHKSDYYRTL